MKKNDHVFGVVIKILNSKNRTIQNFHLEFQIGLLGIFLGHGDLILGMLDLWRATYVRGGSLPEILNYVPDGGQFFWIQMLFQIHRQVPIPERYIRQWKYFLPVKKGLQKFILDTVINLKWVPILPYWILVPALTFARITTLKVTYQDEWKGTVF